MQFTNTGEMWGKGFRNTWHLFKLLNYMVSSMGFPHPNSDFYGGRVGGDT